MPKKNITGIRIHGMCIIYPNGRVVMPNSEMEFVSACEYVGIELNVKSNIVHALEYMYGYPVHCSHNLKGQNNQQLYRELEIIVQNIPEYVNLKKKINAIRKNNPVREISQIERYVIENYKRKSLTWKIMKERRHK